MALQNVKTTRSSTPWPPACCSNHYKGVLGDYTTDDEPRHCTWRTSVRPSSAVSTRPCSTRASPPSTTSSAWPAHWSRADELLKYISVVTLNNRYGIKARERRTARGSAVLLDVHRDGPRPQRGRPHLGRPRLLREDVEAGIHRAGSTLVNVGTAYPQLSNRFVMEMQDDIENIAKSVRDVMWLTKGTGGIGLSVTKLRAQGSPIRSNNTTSTGPIPFMHTIDLLRAVSRGGKKFGALASTWRTGTSTSPSSLTCVRTPWTRTVAPHRRHRGLDQRRVHEARAERRRLVPLRPSSGRPQRASTVKPERYAFYAAEAEAGRLHMFKKIGARAQFKDILMSLQTTSHPWLTWKDTINNRALNNNTGTIHLSNT